MKKIRINYLYIAAVMILSLGACKKSFIEIEPEGVFLSTNYYANREQAYAGLVAVYDVVRKNSGGFENMITMMNAGSDDQYAGGGGPSDGAGIHGFSDFTINAQTIPGSFWNDHYQGIFRANVLLSKLPAVPMDAVSIARFTAETKALRAFYYFNLVRMFKNVPLLLEPLTAGNMNDVVQAPPAEVYAQIEKDLTEAIPDLPANIPQDEYGRITKGIAQALLGKVYLYDNKNTLAAAQLAEVNGTPGGTSQYGYRLLTNFADLWVPANKFNSESIFECSHTSQGNGGWGNWGQGTDEGNTVNVMVGPRGYVRKNPSTAPFLPSGWSFNIFTQNFYDFIKTDPRFTATLFDLDALVAANQVEPYIAGDQNTGYFLNKFLPRQVDVTTGGGDAVLNYRQDTYIIRLADTYLMEAEALGATGARAQALFDAVRARVGLPSIPVSLANIKLERRAELAGEGHRFFDLVRWGDAASRLGSRGFQAGKNEIFPIPARELIATKLVQNPNYN